MARPQRHPLLTGWRDCETPESDPEYIGAFRDIPVPDPDAWARWQEEHQEEIDAHLARMRALLQGPPTPDNLV